MFLKMTLLMEDSEPTEMEILVTKDMSVMKRYIITDLTY